MASITWTMVYNQGQQTPLFRYVFRLTPERVKTLTPEQKEEALLEFLLFVNLMVSVIYNPLASCATRLLALDVISTQVQRASRKLIPTVTDKSPTFAPETQKRLGLSKNTISSGYKTLEKAGVLIRSHRTDEQTQQEHLDIAPTPALFTTPEIIRDKKPRATPTRPKLVVSSAEVTRRCLECDSPNVRVTCRECGSFLDLGDTSRHNPPQEEAAEPRPITNIVTTSKSEVTTKSREASEEKPITNFGIASESEVTTKLEEASQEKPVTNIGTASQSKVLEDEEQERREPVGEEGNKERKLLQEEHQEQPHAEFLQQSHHKHCPRVAQRDNTKQAK